MYVERNLAVTNASASAAQRQCEAEPAQHGDQRDITRFLRSIAMFQDVDTDGIARLASQCEVLSLPGGRILFEQDSASDALYIVRSGMLGAYSAVGDRPGLVATIGAGEIVGEMGMITQRPRSAMIRSLRDSVVLRLPQQRFHELVTRHPAAMMKALSVAVTRLQSDDVVRMAAPRTIAVLPHDNGIDVRRFVRQFADALASFGDCTIVDAQAGRGKDSQWFAALEDRCRFVLYVADGRDAAWRRLCCRQADCFILPVSARQVPSPWPDGRKFSAESVPTRPRHLVLLHEGAVQQGSAERWLAHVGGAQHHHVRNSADVSRVARLTIGRGVGLVLSGGGARGFAHLGVVRALREAGKPIDCIGGTSIGAIVGAGIAADWSHEEAVEKFRRAFVAGKPLNDYTLPFVSMTRGYRVSRLLSREFGALDIRDLPIRFFSVATNLTEGRERICREGPLWMWLRASSAIPGVLPPLLRDGEVFVDGAVLDNFPVGPMRQQGVTDIVGVDIGTDNALRAQIDEHALPSWWRVAYGRFRAPHSRPGILRILLRSGMLNAEVANAQRRAKTSLLLTPPVGDIDLLGWSSFDKAVDAGYRYASEMLAR